MKTCTVYMSVLNIIKHIQSFTQPKLLRNQESANYQNTCKLEFGADVGIQLILM